MSDDPEKTDDERPSTKAQPRYRWLGLLLAVSLLTNLGLLYWLRPAKDAVDKKEAPQAAVEAEATDTVELSVEALKRAGIELVEVENRAWQSSIVAPGRLTINEDATAQVGSFVEGRVTRVVVKVGDRVTQGQPLVYIHSHEVAQARSDYARARSAIVRADRNLSQAKIDLDRATRLLEAKALSLREQQHAAANVTAINTELEQARAEEHRAEEFLHHLGASPTGEDDAVVRAPQSGTVLRRSVSPGTVVTASTELLVITRLATLWAIAEVPESQASAVKPGQSIELKVAAFPGTVFSGRVIYIGEALNRVTRTFEVRCLLENERGQLRPEMFAEARIRLGASDRVPTVAREAIQEVRGERCVFIALGDGKFEKRRVETGREEGDRVEIKSGIEVGSRVVSRGAFFVKSEFLKGTLSDD